MYLNSSLNYERKYKKYKSKYQILKNQLGGDCDPLPKKEDQDIISTENLFYLKPSERITIQNKCYEVRSLYKNIFQYRNYILPLTQTQITEEEKERLIQAHLKLVPNDRYHLDSLEDNSDYYDDDSVPTPFGRNLPEPFGPVTH